MDPTDPDPQHCPEGILSFYLEVPGQPEICHLGYASLRHQHVAGRKVAVHAPPEHKPASIRILSQVYRKQVNVDIQIRI